MELHARERSPTAKKIWKSIRQGNFDSHVTVRPSASQGNQCEISQSS